MVSFSQHTKHELARLVPESTCCHRCELAAMLIFSGSLQMQGGQRPALVVFTELPAVARKIVTLAHKSFTVETEVRVRRRERLQKNLSYLVRIIPHDSLPQVLQDLSLLDGSSAPLWGIPWPLLRETCCRWAFVRGAFLAKGSVTDPEKTYHWEIGIEDQFLGEELIELVAMLGINLGLTDRKKGYIVYSKNADEVAALLAGMGAYNAVLSLENTRVVKEMRNTVNRQVNCETANLDKTVEAALRQISAIRRLENAGKLNHLSKKLRNAAEIRLQNPSASLAELGELAEPPLDKSTVASRLRRLEELAKEIRD